LAIAWVLARGPHIIPIPGTKRRKYLLDNVGALDVTMTTADFEQIDQLLKRYPNIGDRYNEGNYRFLEKSEKPG
jgi:aryl-alcohol dehydrogenase-like predicted oxidoreductase